MVQPSLDGARAAAALEATSDAVLFLDHSWVIAYVNGATERLLARPAADLVGRRLWDEFPHAVDGPFWHAYHQALETGRPTGFETYREPESAWFEVRIFPDRDGLTVFLRDTSEARRASEIAQREVEVLEGIARHAPLEQTLEEVTRLAELCLPGSASAVLLADEAREWLTLLESVSRLPPEMATAAARIPFGAGGGVAGTAACTRRLVVVDVALDARATPFRELALRHGIESAWAYPMLDFEGRSLGVLACYRDRPGAPTPLEESSLALVTGLAALALERDRTHRELQSRAMHDPLTGLPNRTLLLDRTAHALAAARRTGQLVGMIFCDVNRFKRVNDTRGHAVGDQLLVAVAERLRAAARECDTVARLGGDEYVVLCEGPRGEDELLEIADRLIAAVSAPLDVGGVPLTPSLSAGVAVASGNRGAQVDNEAEALLRDADLAMYVAKNGGHGRAHAVTRDMRERQDRRRRLEQDLRRALEVGGIGVHYQPQVRLPDLRPVGVEALVRWTHDELGPVSAAELIAVAEDSGLVVALGRSVLRAACEAVARWTVRRPPRLSVNVSVRQLMDPALISHVEGALVASGLDAARLCLEIRESALMDDAPNLVSTLHELRALGVGISIDDLGTGYSSLRYLKRLPVTELKVDGSFVAGLGHDSEDGAIVAAVASLGSSLDLRVVAEGVETREQERHLIALGCPLAQGYRYSRPLPLPDLRDWWDAGGPLIG